MLSFKQYKDKSGKKFGKEAALVKDEEDYVKPIFIHNDLDGYKIPNPMESYQAEPGEMILPATCGNKGFFNFYTFGPCGSGKSYAIERLLKIRQQYFNDKRKIYTFNPCPDDYQWLKTKGQAPVIEIPLRDLEECDVPPIEEFANSIIIFDDVFYIADRSVRKKVIDFMNEVLTTGRHYGPISTFITAHVGADGPVTKHCINEATHIMLFRGGNAAQKKYIYETKIGIDDKKKIQELTKDKGRYVLVHTNFPKYIITTKAIEIVD